jgi:hypothetical protein
MWLLRRRGGWCYGAVQRLTHYNGSAAEVYLFGACVTSLTQPHGSDVLYLRPDATFDGSKPIACDRLLTLRARWVTLRARWVTLRARWVTLRARRVTLRARWVTLRAR